MSFNSIFLEIEVNQDESGLFYIFVNIFMLDSERTAGFYICFALNMLL